MSFQHALERHRSLFSRLDTLQPEVEAQAEDVLRCLHNGGKVMFMGNGGSAADCQHLAAEFVVRYRNERKPLAALALTVDTSILTAHTNDYCFDTLFSRQIEALCKPQDLVIGLSTSGNSENVIRGITAANEIGAVTWSWTGEDGGRIKTISNQCIRVPSSETARIQEAHIFIGHWICEYLDTQVASR